MISKYPELMAQLDLRDVVAYFQPIYNLREGSVVGVEALLRPINVDGDMLSPALVFERAAQLDLLLELERAARFVALRTYAEADNPEKPILFLNFSARLLDNGELDPGHIFRTVTEFGIEPSRIAIEIVESGVESPSDLASFAERNRASGFLISLDDFGTEHSNLERVALVSPEIIKIDRSIVAGVSRNELKQSVLRSIVYLARTIGALTLAEGLEEYDDLLMCVAEGVELGQGFLLGRPAADPCRANKKTGGPAQDALTKLQSDLQQRARDERTKHEAAEAEVTSLVAVLAGKASSELEMVLQAGMASRTRLECGYLVSTDGIQESDTIINARADVRIRHPMFHPAERGTDHNRKDYIYGLLALGNHRYLTQPYVSFATGGVCRTLATRFTSADGADHILCVDMRP